MIISNGAEYSSAETVIITRDKSKLIERYSPQIALYSQALEKAFGRKVDEKYLLSLKESTLIKLN